jgi:NAD(P)H-nitrite reductase large subunit
VARHRPRRDRSPGQRRTLPYTGLVLATGSTPALALPGADAPNVLPLRTRDDASAIADLHGPVAIQSCRWW